MPILHRDYETRSVVNLKEVGAYQYATHPYTEVLCCAYAVDDGPIKLWLQGDPVPQEFSEAANNSDWIIAAHNDRFESLIEQHIMAPRYGWPLIPLTQHRCTMAAAHTRALPGSLEKAAEALKLEHQKDEEGHRLMLRMCKPRKPHKGEDPNGIYWHDSPALRARLGQYCKQDVEVERELHSRIGFISEAEQKVWEVDRVINDRGVFIDTKLLDGALSITSAREAEIQQEIAALTEGQVTSISQVDKLGEWLKGQGCEIANLQDETLQKLLKRMDLPSLAVRQAIQLRLDGASAAASKHFKLKKQCGAGDRVRGGFIYHVGGTGRWGSWGVQLQNMKKPETKEIELAISLISGGDLQAVKQHFTDTMGAAGDISRALLCASPGHRLLIADYSGIESRVGAWIAGEQSKVDAWRRFDETKNPKDEPYYQTGKNFGRPEEEARGVGKTANLAFMYMGGIPSWRRFANDKTSTDEQIKGFRDRWRAEHPNIVRFWKNLTMSAARAVRRPNTRVPCGRVSFTCDDFFLRMRLPSGREIFYPQPHVEADEFGNPIVLFKDNAKGFTDTRAWSGHLMNNVVQGTARDILAEALPRLEAAGYPVVMHIHDEVVCEVPDGVGTLDEFKRLMTTLPEWAEGLPIAIGKPRNGQRFAKIEAPAARQSDANSTPEPEIIQSFRQEPPSAAPVKEIPMQENVVAFPPKRHSSDGNVHGASRPPRGRRTAQFFYPHLDRSEYLRVDRYDGAEREFHQSHWDGKQWASGVKGTYAERKIPYRLPELKAALQANPDVQVQIAEGESDADALARLGFVVTTNPGGALSWTPELTNWLRVLGVRNAVIHEDNDGEAHGFKGQKRTALLIKELSGFIKLGVVRYPDVPEGEDVRYWLEHGHTKDELEARIAAAEPAALPFPFINMSNWDYEPIPEQEWTVPGRIPRRQSVIFSGEGGAGKSLIQLHLSAATALGRDWFGEIPEQGPALFIDCEDDEKVIHYRLAAIAKHYGVCFTELIKSGLHPSTLVGKDTVLATVSRSGLVEPTPLYHQLLQAAGDIKPGIIGIAASANVFAGNENDRAQVQQFVNLTTRIAIAANGAVVLITHPSNTGVSSGTGLSGSTQWHNAVRARFYLKGVKPEPGEQPDKHLREIEFKKNQYGDLAESIALRWQDGLYLPIDGATFTRAEQEGRADEVFLELLRRFNAENRHVSNNLGPTYAPALFAREESARRAGLSSASLTGAMRRLFEAKKIFNEPHGKRSRERFHIVIRP